MLNKKFLKSLLTTASTIAFVASSATSASASAIFKTSNTDAGIRINGGHGDDDYVTYGFEANTQNWLTTNIVSFDSGADNQGLTTGEWGDVGIKQIVVRGGTPSLNIIGHTTTVTIIDGDATTDKLSVTLQNGTAFVVNSSDLPSLGTINAASAGNGTVTISAAVTKGHVGVIGGTGKVGTVNINGAESSFSNAITAGTLDINKSTTFDGVITADTLSVDAATTFNENATASTANVSAGASFAEAFTVDTLNLDTAFNSSVTTGTGLLTLNTKAVIENQATLTIGEGGISGGGIIDGSVNGHGYLVINGAVNSGDIGVIGGVGYLDTMTVNKASTFNNNIKSRVLTVNADTTIGYFSGNVLTLGEDAELTSTGNLLVGVSATLNSGSVLNVNGTAVTNLTQIDGAASGNGELVFNRVVTAGQVGIIGGTTKIGTFTTAGDGSTFNSAISATTMNVNNNTTFGGVLTATDFKLAASKSATTNGALDAKVTLNNGSVLTISATGGTGSKTITGSATDTGKVVFSAAVANNVGAISDLNEVKIDAASTFNNTIAATNVNVNEDTTFDGELTATTLTLAANKSATTNAALDANVTLNDASVLVIAAAGGTGGKTITGSAADTGVAIISAAVESNVGAISKLNEVRIDEESTFNNTVEATKVNVNNDTTFGENLTATTLTIDNNTKVSTSKTLDLSAGGALLGEDSILTVNAEGGTSGGTVDGDGEDNYGTLRFTAIVNNNVGVIGGTNKVNTFTTSADGSVFNNNISADDFQVKANTTFSGALNTSTFTVNASQTATTNGKLTLTNGTIYGTLDGNGVIHFAGDGTLTVDGNIEGGHAITTTTDNQGTLTLKNAVEAGNVGQIGAFGNEIHNVNVNGEGSNVFGSNIFVNGLTFANDVDGTLNAGVNVYELFIANGSIDANHDTKIRGQLLFTEDGNFTVNDNDNLYIEAIDSNTNYYGTLIFNRQVNTLVTGTSGVGSIGATCKLKALEVNYEGDNTFSEAIQVHDFTLGKGANVTTESIVTLNDFDENDGTLTINSGTFTSNGTLTLASGGANFVADGTLVVHDELIGSRTISTYADGKGTLILDKSIGGGHADVGQIGASGKAIYQLDLNDGGTIGSNVYAKTINSSASNLTIDSDITVVGNVEMKTNHVLTLNNSASLTGNVSTATKNEAEVYLSERSKFVGDIGTSKLPVSLVEINGDVADYSSMQGNVYTKTFNHNGGLKLTGDLTVSSAITAGDESATTLNGKTLTTAGLILGDDVTTTIDCGNGGSVILTSAEVGAGGFSITADHAAKIKFDFQATAAVPAYGEVLTPMVINSTGEGTADVKAYLEANANGVNIVNNHYLTLSTTPVITNDSGKLSVTFASSPKSVSTIGDADFSELKSGNNSIDTVYTNFITASANNTLGLTERKVIAELGASTNTIEDVAEQIKGFNKTDTNAVVSAAASATASSIDAVTSAINSRVSAVSSGDEDRAMGAWVSVTGGIGKQGSRKGEAGFASNNFGATLGTDTEINDKAIIGLALTLSNASVKMKNALAGDKVKAKTYALSLYGNYNIDNCWNVQGALSVARTKSTVSTAISKAKFNSTNIGAKAMVGYEYEFKEVMFTPMAGLEYANLGKSKATEATTIAGVNKITKIKTMNKIAAIFGIKASKEIQGFTPEVHAFVNYDLKSRTPKSTIHLGTDGTVDFATPHAKLARASYNVGTSVSYMYDNIDYAIGYDATIAKKYLAHQGSIKLRLNF